jgi:hypothetical protein
MWLILTTLGLASAHSPHDVASVLSRAPDGALLTNDSDILALSTDDGATFSYRYWVDGVARCVFATSSERWIVASETTGAWLTEDAGANFQFTGGPEGVTACGQSSQGFFIAGPGGLWWSEEGSEWTPHGLETEWEAQSLEVRESGLIIAVDEQGGGWRLDPEVDLAWQPLGGEDLLVIRAIDAQGQELVAGRESGEMLVSVDGGLTWTSVPDSPWNVRVLTVSGDTWLAASDTEAVWVGTEQGTQWELDDEGLDPLAEGNGGPSDGIHYFHLRVEEDRWLLGSFEGLYWKEPNANHWRQAELDIIPRVRSVAWLESELLVGAYGGGVYRGTPGGSDWHEISKGIGWSYPKQVVPTDTAGEDLWVVSGSALFHSLDGGETWDSAPVLLSEAGDMLALHPAYPDTPYAAVGGRVLSGQAAVATTRDEGETWTVTILPGTCRAKPRALAWDDVLRVACGTEGGLYLSLDDGMSFSFVDAVGAEVHQILTGSRVLLGTDGGVFHWTESDEITPYSLLGTPVTAIAEGPDGEIWLGTPGSGLAHLDSTREPVWMAWPEGDYIEDIAVSATGELAVALRTGAWWSHDGGLSFTRANDYDRIDDRLQHWWFDGFGTEVLEEASTGYVQLGTAGSVAHLRFSGSQLRLLGAPVAGTQITIDIDGEFADAPCWEEGMSPGLLWSIDLDPGPHELRVEVESGTLRLDGAERWQTLQPSLPDDIEETKSSSRCGCSSGTDSAWLMLSLSLWPWKRRRREMIYTGHVEEP